MLPPASPTAEANRPSVPGTFPSATLMVIEYAGVVVSKIGSSCWVDQDSAMSSEAGVFGLCRQMLECFSIVPRSLVGLCCQSVARQRVDWSLCLGVSVNICGLGSGDAFHEIAVSWVLSEHMWSRFGVCAVSLLRGSGWIGSLCLGFSANICGLR